MISNNLITNEEMNSTEQTVVMPEIMSSESSTKVVCESPAVLNKTQAKRRMGALMRKIETTKATLDSLYTELSSLRAEFPEPEEKPKGRPKKPSAKASPADSSTEDLFAKMVADNMSSPSTILDAIAEEEAPEEPAATKEKKKAPVDALTKSLMALEKKEYLAEQKRQAAVALEEAKAAKLAALEEAKAAKAAALEEAKAAKLAALEQEKAAKLAALEEAKAAKLAEKKAALEQEKAAKKAALEQEKAAKKAATKEKAPTKEKVNKKAAKVEKEEHDSRACPAFVEPAPVKLTVTWAVVDGIKYLKAASGVLYNPDTKEAIGIHDEEANTIKPLPEEDDDEDEMVEEEYDDSSN
jgi:hypothetical protein